MKRRLPPEFFRSRTALQLARELLGCVLIHETPGGRIGGIIRETEAYSERDEASHSFGGRKTDKNAVMFSDGGHAYVYFTYGRYYCMNIVAGRAGAGSAVLLRAVTPVEGIAVARNNRMRARSGKRPFPDTAIANGPGKLCQAFNICGGYNGIDMTDSASALYVTAGQSPKSITRTPRIGISKGKDALWRFVGEFKTES